LQEPDAQKQEGKSHYGEDANPEFIPEAVLFFLFGAGRAHGRVICSGA
jgi:hypothetical protein